MTMKLIGSLSSPFVRKVRIALAEKKLDYQFEPENVWSDDTRIQDSNPLGKVPCLIMEDGGAVFDSRVIVEYLDTITPVGRLLPPTGRDRTEIKCWEALADGLLDAAVLIRIEHTQRFPEQRNQKWLDRQQGKIDAALLAMSTGLGANAYCASTAFTLADLSTGCALSYLDLRQPGLDWRGRHDNLARLYARLAQRPSFIATELQG